MKTSTRLLHQFRNRGFTLVEVVIVLAIIGIMLPIVFSVMFTVARQQNKIYRLSEAKTEGDYAMAFIKTYIRNNGDRIFKDPDLGFEACFDSSEPDNQHLSQDGDEFYIRQVDSDDEAFQFYADEYETMNGNSHKQIIFNQAGTKYPLTSTRMVISNFEISCFRRTAASQGFVFISFALYYKTDLATARPEDIAILNYSGIARLR